MEFAARYQDGVVGDVRDVLCVIDLAADPVRLVILDAQRMSEGPVATIKIPVRLKYGIHGNWVPAA